MEFTSDQRNALEQFVQFDNCNEQFPIFILSGYAGTGKTTLVSWIIDTFNTKNRKFRLLAPTGRAAKVLSSYTGEIAYTIHKQIYFHNEKDGNYFLSLAKNLHTNTIFFVDEASMISTHEDDEGRCLLKDLLNYVFLGKNCKIVFIGDHGQLPPVGQKEANALSNSYLKNTYSNLSIFSIKMSEIVRQEQASSIVKNATEIRNAISMDQKIFNYIDNETVIINQSDLQEELDSAIGKYGIDEVKVLGISNKRVLGINEGIRNRLLFFENILEKEDRIMVNKNNYYWLKNDKDIGFIANGEILVIEKVLKIESKYSFLFARIKVSFLDFPEKDPIDVLVNLQLLSLSQLQLDFAQMRVLFSEIENEYISIKSKNKRIKAVYDDPYWNALQVKYAYAFTTHKAQGGQWKHVFIDYMGKSPDMDEKNYLKWLYTSVTRATKKIYLVNFPEKFFN